MRSPGLQPASTQSPGAAGPAALENIVLELANQVKGLQGLVQAQMEEKIHWQDQAQSLQEKYVTSIESLKKDLVSFKAKLADENRSIYSEF